MPDLSDLIARVEAASGPDRELDLAINLALFPDGEISEWMKYPRGLSSREGYSWDIHGASIIFEKRTADGRCPHNGGVPLPRYTASADEALTLRPEGLVIKSTLIAEGLLQVHEVWFCTPDNDALDGEVVIDGYTEPKPPALALLSAILKARQASTEGAK